MLSKLFKLFCKSSTEHTNHLLVHNIQKEQRDVAMRGYWPKQKWLKNDFQKLSHLAHLKFTTLFVSKSTDLNAECWGDANVVTFTTRDLKVLNHDDIHALMAHEIGHLKCYHKDNKRASSIYKILGGVYYVLAFAVMSDFLIIFPNHIQLSQGMYVAVVPALGIADMLVYGAIMAIIGLGVRNLISRRDELEADQVGAHLIGAPKMIHLFCRLTTIEEKQMLKVNQMRDQLWTCMGPFLKCTKLIMHYRWHRFLQHLNLCQHPSLKKRLKNLYKLRER